MQAKTWLRFTWQLGNLDAPDASEFLPLVLRPAMPEHHGTVAEVLAKSTALDSSLGEAGAVLKRHFTKATPRFWKIKDHRCLLVLHGERAVGASLYLASPDADIHLLSGPCVLHEYRNRHLGTWLLQATLHDLQESGLPAASGVCRAHSVLEKYLYPKFGGTAEPYDFKPEH